MMTVRARLELADRIVLADVPKIAHEERTLTEPGQLEPRPASSGPRAHLDPSVAQARVVHRLRGRGGAGHDGAVFQEEGASVAAADDGVSLELAFVEQAPAVRAAVGERAHAAAPAHEQHVHS